MTALHVAISRGYEEICKELVDKGASVTMTTAKGHTSLHLAAASSSTDIVSLVVQSGEYFELKVRCDTDDIIQKA